ncbi:hypothetical protein BGZ61DRAFT_499729 [Ilyonectria robusta]|uniref:uncharacterized protein n=1 Tax=Ilyonectria robusta TaxID=1079257 RepID=UPI001E8E8CB5|nr:uncharacterized protein BGZ61DRAFT_499729 [Ilyonectria robusta]KAH8659537.1 hypothetical protein BGZ61DRAFT_499729 [Ilyonectria robusta]
MVQQELSPPESPFDVATPNRQKRNATDADVIPRPHHGSRVSSPVSSVSTSSSIHSRSSSLFKRQIMGLRLNDAGLEVRQLRVDAAPNPRAASLLDILGDIGKANDILSESQRDSILNSVRPNIRQWRHSFKSPGSSDSLPGRIPSPDEMSQLLQRASECHDPGHDEASWNVEVYNYLLSLILREPGTAKGGLLNFTTWGVLLATTTRPHAIWLPQSTRAKLVDYCIYADLISQDASTTQTLSAFCQKMPTLSANHTESRPSQLRPIVLSIETKRPGSELDAAQLQMSVWHAAQWSFLHSAVLMQTLRCLAFLPDGIFMGHRWLFLFSTREGAKTILWPEI